MSWQEERLLARLRRRATPRVLRTPLGHDAAALDMASAPVVCVDATVEGVHVEHGERPAAFAAKAVLRTLSDLAAAGARPRALLLGLRAPRDAEERRLAGLLRGVERTGERWGAALVGGDCTSAPGPTSLTVTALGELPRGARPVSRSGARPGMVALVTGPLGGSRLGRHLRPVPRLEQGEALAAAGVGALMDLSDGLARDAARLAATSGVAVELDLAALPLHRDARRAARVSGKSPVEHALHDGEDHELLALLPERTWRRLAGRPEFQAARVVGRALVGRGLWLLDGGVRRRWDGAGGWTHGE